MILGYQAAVAAIRARVVDYVRRTWTGLGRWDRADIDRFVAAVVPAVQAGQLTTASLTDAYLAQLERTVLGTAARTVGVSAATVTTEALRGVPAVEVYQRAGVTVWTALKGGVSHDQAVARGLKRATDLAATDLQMSKVATAKRVLEQKPNVVGHRRSLRGGSSCGLCIVASTQRYGRGELQPIHPGCVPAGSVVSVPAGHAAHAGDLAGGQVLAATRRWYAGELVVISTAAGDEVTVTPNHPVLTNQGWLPAGLVGESDHLFRRSGGHGAVGRRPHERQRPALVEDVWRSLCVTGRLLKVPLASEDLHGDGSDSEVDVVWADSDLSSVRDTYLHEPSRKVSFVPAHGGWGFLDGGSSLAAFFPGGGPTPDGFVSGSRLGLALLDCHLGGSDLASPASSTRFDAPAEKFSPESVSAYAERGIDLQRRLAGQVELDRVVETRQVSWSGHVYNLHTAEGWYSTSSHIVSNCDCGIVPIYGERDPGQVINPDRLDNVHDLIAERFGAYDSGARTIPGVTDPQGRPIQYRDVLIIHEHGELGPILGVRGQKFTGPDDV